jgi:hypothetical protein
MSGTKSSNIPTMVPTRAPTIVATRFHNATATQRRIERLALAIGRFSVDGITGKVNQCEGLGLGFGTQCFEHSDAPVGYPASTCRRLPRAQGYDRDH